MSTCYLILVIVRRYPDLVNWLFGVLAIDVAGHWVHNYAYVCAIIDIRRCALIEKENHKNVPDATFVLRIYYQKKIVMFLSIVGYETFLCSLYGRSFYKAYTPMYELGTTLMIVSSPLAFFKVLTNVLQGLYGLQKINKFERMRYEGSDAARCFIDAAKAEEANSEPLSAAAHLLEAASALQKADPHCMSIVIGRFAQGGRALKAAAEAYEQRGDLATASELFKKAAEQYDLDEFGRVAGSQCKLRFADLTVCFNDDIIAPLKIYEQEGFEHLKNNLLQYGAKELLLKAGLSRLVEDDITDADIAYSRYCSADTKFASSREGRLLKAIIDAKRSDDLDKFTLVVDGIMGTPVASIWTKHVTKEGRCYFFNQLTKKSQWDKPDELKTDEERLMEAQTSWKLYETAEGKSYYYNTKTKESVWEPPQQVKELLSKHGATSQIDKDTLRANFMQWLETFNFGQRTSWETAVKSLEANPRWAEFAAFTRGEKKQLFSEFSSQIYRRDLEELRRKKSMLGEMMTDALRNWEELNYYTSYVEFAKKFNGAKWFEWGTEKERDDIFQEYVENMEKELKQRHKDQRASSIARLEDHLTNMFKSSSDLLTWSQVKIQFSNFEGLHLIDVLDTHKAVFRNEYRRRLQEAERRSFRIQRKCRARFLAFLQESVEKGEIGPRTDYSTFIRAHATEAVYLDVVGHHGSTPYDLFREVQKPLRDLIRTGYLARNASYPEYERAASNYGIAVGNNLKHLHASLTSKSSGIASLDDVEEGEIPIDASRQSVESISSNSIIEG
ncbi:bifunctional WW domain/FF domain/Pre-mRNA-processing factor Prp40/Tetratricopeptide-like helical domain superfamily/FF domain superfamily/WW domain superfamily [Babesia duncani]|uniref:Bifunctional WW domain/FF domain/Pre-mRNA-processing factor Prp40/Tetratricopeptide-like helical domain superfamily/FF domain superfamily/WW domain superfamily n=1 Tax=Babesia duncani TaxID=323732 RepID=A0AAD9PJG8_9APIC|nr:bifunctional WW domain/FF domain/Pre-mRNA-processing factor Prp40/Tetratricopeptide-like helical domain superfamily/FF domain superfamily/WW domain superfamily [Babesia duncani]